MCMENVSNVPQLKLTSEIMLMKLESNPNVHLSFLFVG